MMRPIIFKANAKILNGEAISIFKGTFRVTYSKPSNAYEYWTVLWSNSFPADSWTEIDTSYTLMSTELQDYSAVGLTLYFEAEDNIFDFLIHEISMEPVVGRKKSILIA
jgi:hypothetical protein